LDLPFNQSSGSNGLLPTPAIYIIASLERFQIREQRYILDTFARIRKCGLEGVWSTKSDVSEIESVKLKHDVGYLTVGNAKNCVIDDRVQGFLFS
jgi:hypothetical protein